MNDLPAGWARVALASAIGGGLFSDGDWIETKDQDPSGEVRLIQLADIGDGEFRDRSSRFLTSRNAERLGCTFLERGDVLVARMPDPLGRACVFPGVGRPAVTAVDVCVMRPTAHGINPTWLMWAINSPQIRSQVAALQSGTTRKRISRRNLGATELWLPPLAEQGRIVSAIEAQLSRLDAAESSVGRARSALSILRESLIDSATSRARDVFPLRDLVADTLIGLDRARRFQSAGPPGAPYIRMQNVTTTGTLDTSVVTFVTVDDAQADRYRVEVGDVLFNTRNSVELVGKTACVESIPEGAVFNNNLMRIRTRDNVRPRYLAAAMNSRTFRLKLDRVKRATTSVAAIYAKDLMLLPLQVPPVDEQDEILRRLDLHLSVVDATSRVVDRTQRRSKPLRQRVLSDAASGRLLRQDPDEEPASALLERMALEREVSLRNRRAAKARMG